MPTKTSQTKHSKTPKLRFPGFSGEWEEKRLENLVSVFRSGESITSSNITEVGDYPVYGGNGLRGYSDRFTHDGYYFLIGRQGALCGNINKVNGKIFISEHAIAVKANTSSNTDWLALRLAFLNLNRLSESSAQPGLSVEKLKRLKLITPTENEQQKIADFLSSTDQWIETLRSQKETLESYKAETLRKIFNQGIRFKDDEGKEFPEWEEKKLNSLGRFISGQGFSDNEQGGKAGIPFYKVSDMNLPGNEKIMNSANHYVTDEQIKRLKYKVNEEKSIIFAKVGAAIFLERKRLAEKFLLDNNMMAFIPSINVEFIQHLFATIRLSQYAQVGALPSYNSTDLGIIKTSIPRSKLEQQKIADFLTSIDKLIEAKQKQITLAERWKKGLMQNLFV